MHEDTIRFMRSRLAYSRGLEGFVQTQTKMTDMTRVTLVIPNQLWENVKRLVPAGRRSRLVTEALEAEVGRRQQQELLESIRQFQDYLFQKYGESSSSAEDINMLREERDAEITSLR
jgi:hypothetical protein